MAGELPEDSPGSVRGGGFLELLQNLGREEILEVLSQGFCQPCQACLESRIHDYISNKRGSSIALSADDSSLLSSETTPLSSNRVREYVNSALNGYSVSSSPASVDSKQHLSKRPGFEMLLNDGLGKALLGAENGLSEEQKEQIRVSEVGRKKDFVHYERIGGKATNVIQGLELHTKVFNAEEQKTIVECVYELQRMGQKGRLRDRTYSEPKKWMRGKGRVTMQFGCCYNYAVDKDGNLPGIIRDEEVDPLPPLFKQMIKRLVRWRVLPPTCVPNSCIVNIYDEGDCIPPHIDHHDFLRPFCTVSFLTECNILFGSSLKIINPGEFSGPVSIPLPVGSVLILNGNGADVAKHCVPGVPAKRISITFRKMDDSKLPYTFSPDPELSGIKPFIHSSPSNKSATQQSWNGKSTVGYSSLVRSPNQQNQHQNGTSSGEHKSEAVKTSSNSFLIDTDNFPPLGSSNSATRSMVDRVRSKQ
ncbi:hypothetical protein HS088_TW08G00506 [Tripterygium wilfordii]|uniref:Fe2OG dioxygenase domain-containing protein n=1 Tax=Tripterygium wilfordii TaxID=458696 RepID=A0A7J7DCD6_TRIWF|nr:RNA demethylase ALKBH9B-like [Tripterygium wilfordii]KAF5743918.1 hypothetical protein HS088_TW08G00506 [Tripterygium wilfordii]